MNEEVFMPVPTIALTTVTIFALGGPCAQPAAAMTTGNPVISELAPSGPGGSRDEYLELHNDSDNPVSIGGWRLYACDSVSSPSLMTTFPAGTVLAARGDLGQYLLLAGDEYLGRSEHPGPQSPDIWYSFDTSASDGWMLADRYNRRVDGIGTGEGCDDNPLVPRCRWSDAESATRDFRARAEADGYVCGPASPTNSMG